MDFNIRPLSKNCSVTGEPLPPGKPCWSVLVEQEGKLVRLDISADAWDGPPEDSVGHWQAEVPEEVDDGKRLLDTESLFEYFQQLSEAPNKTEEQYQYVLALLLLRKRRLILEEDIEIDDQPAMRLISSTGEGPFDVMEQQLTDSEVQQLQNQLFGAAAA